MLVSCGGASEPSTSQPTTTIPATGTLVIAISGLPTNATPSIVVTGAGGFNRTVSAAGSITSLTAGNYTIARPR